jgi:hypothetical protein
MILGGERSRGNALPSGADRKGRKQLHEISAFGAALSNDNAFMSR